MRVGRWGGCGGSGGGDGGKVVMSWDENSLALLGLLSVRLLDLIFGGAPLQPKLLIERPLHVPRVPHDQAAALTAVAHPGAGSPDPRAACRGLQRDGHIARQHQREEEGRCLRHGASSVRVAVAREDRSSRASPPSGVTWRRPGCCWTWLLLELVLRGRLDRGTSRIADHQEETKWYSGVLPRSSHKSLGDLITCARPRGRHARSSSSARSGLASLIRPPGED